ncbi:addiction module protein [Nannocystaceae bacterium ST9]
MNHRMESILQTASELSRAERIELAAILTDGAGEPNAEIEAAWLAESKRRWAAVESGEAETISLEEVERRLHAIVQRARSARERTG